MHTMMNRMLISNKFDVVFNVIFLNLIQNLRDIFTIVLDIHVLAYKHIVHNSL